MTSPALDVASHIRITAWLLRHVSKLGSFCGDKVQGIAIYRHIARFFRPPTVVVEQASEADVEQIGGWFFPDPGQTLSLHRERTTYFVARRVDKVIGMVQLSRHGEGSHPLAGYRLLNLKVRAVYRRMGIGEELTQVVLDKAREEGAKRLSLIVNQDNHRAMELYHKLGFKIEPFPLDDSSRVLMSKSFVGSDVAM